ncbi:MULTISPECIES: methyl-accepting chemotaxis protein [Kosakonia]|uniref:methyl-accepting chemotaxis protein n=1 Tax=Kosakonia TaxID=1330547 RepID=UPI0019083F33|nr:MULTISPECIES: methyl-accepting chemotaxis protein [Kosakonia]MBK0016449.1 HAMP domain-containing protein [Kosakonia sp. S42]MBK0078215.1 HAMP domain-containing protein [Kosakonia sp. S57]MBK0085193.1 HAMP domain-containing protein [Kosakonia sp. S58]UGS47417.1 HAMP domain-containing protein [Kosakonia cowanii]
MKNLLNKINLSTKFMVLGIISLLLFALPTALFVNESSQKVQAKQVELKAIPVEKKLLKLLNLIQRHRAESAIAVTQGNPAYPPRIALRDQINVLADEIRKDIAAESPEAHPLQQLDKVNQQWQALQNQIDSRSLTAPESLVSHAALIRSLLDFNIDVLDFYGLSLDPDLDTSQLITAALFHLPELTETLGQIRASGTSLLAKKDGISETDNARMEFQIGNGEKALQLFDVGMKKYLGGNEEIRNLFGRKTEGAVQGAAQALSTAREIFITHSRPAMAPTEYVAIFTEAINNFTVLGNGMSDELSQQLTKQISAQRSAQITLLAVLIFSALLGIALTVFIIRSITGPVNEAARIAQEVATGDLTSRIAVTGSNEMSALLQSLMKMSEHLSSLVNDIKNNAVTIATSSEEIASGNSDLSSRTEEQAASLAQTAASMEQLASIIQQNADNTRHAASMAGSATSAALLGGEAMESVLASMHKISNSAGQIEEIIAVIDGIAFQTNILALNAAVEAARAGEHGKGFAVVASEVRALAQRSAVAAKEIKELIENSVSDAQSGIKMAENAGDKVKQSVSAIEQTSMLINEVSASSAEQSSGVSQINIAVSQMDQVTQQNAGLVQQSASSADDLAERAARLRQLVAVFKTQ